jgi:hypothetical protein
VRELDDPARQLRLTIHLGVPTGPDDDESRLLYQPVLESGAARGIFELADDADSRARGLVAMEDGPGSRWWLATPASGAPRRS